MLTFRSISAAALLLLVAGDVHASTRPVNGPSPAAAPTPPLAPPLASGHVAVLAHDPGRGVPSLLWAPSPEPAAVPRGGLPIAAAARQHLGRHARLYRVGRAALAGLQLRFVHDTGRGGIIVALRPSVAGVEVFRGDVKLLLDRQMRLLAISGAPHPAAHAGSARPFTLGPDAAVVRALADLHAELPAPRLLAAGTRDGWTRLRLAPTADLQFRQPARVKPVYFPVGDALVPGHFVELQVQVRGGALEVFQYVIAADDGRVLHRHDATASEAFKYRVWADADGDHRPADGPLTDFTPHPTGIPGKGPTDATAPNLITMDGFNTNPDDLADPWLAPLATTTRGNNVHAYVDHKNPTGLQIDQGEFLGATTAPGVFDRVYDVKAEPLASVDQSMAAITQLFYVNNWMHDWWYDSGFNEATGNAQEDNYGRGGAEHDPLLAEAQDAALVGTRNNANMATPADGASPVMQMYLWSPLVTAGLTVDPLAKSFAVNSSNFGPKNYDKTATLVLMQDGGGMSVTDGCEPAVNDIAGKIVLVDRGTCSFETKVSKAQASGAIGVLIANNANGPFTPGVDNNIPDPTIPSQGITKADGATLKAALVDPQSAHMTGLSTVVERDGTIDNMIVAHEWGHFIHHRLVDCGNNQCRAQSEGWGDFNALLMMLREGDELDGVYAGTTYANFDVSGYFGIRRVPYSVDTDKNALSFRHIADGQQLPQNHPLGATGGPNSEVHNAGEIWATMLWEAYIALIKANPKLSFDEARRLMSDYVVAGMMLTPVDPTYTEQRDALLLAIKAADAADFLTVAGAFATRGAGSCAVSPPRDSTDFIGVKESSELRANATIVGVSLADDLLSCDDDGYVDVGELGTLKVDIVNIGAAAMAKGSTVEVINPDPALVFPLGSVTELSALGPLEQTTALLQLAVDDGLAVHLPLAISVRLTTPGGCTETVETFLRADLNGDVLPESSQVEDVETPASAWSIGGTEPEGTVWGRAAAVDGFHWHGADIGRASDTWLESPWMLVSADEPLVISWDHAYSFEFSDNTYWDGGVFEISPDGGKSWQDVLDFTAQAGYDAPINSEANPLDKRQAYVDKNPSYPDSDTQVIDIGDALAGAEIKFRFRIGTDAAAGAAGWDIDNIVVEGITNSPFASWIADAAICAEEGTSSGGDSSGGGASTGTDGVTASSSGDATGATSSDTSGATGGTTTGGASTSGTGTGGTGSGGTGSGGTGSGGTGPGDESGSTPTTTAGPAATGSSDSSGGSDGGGELAQDSGCGCRLDERDGGRLVWQLAPWLGLLGLRRRRRERPAPVQ
ncbi:M36 family metallopeptidase [Nannocystis sp.]|uniref:M36 family metallopeptidase n=1 Tax=Nannocystis sp. TaxID=1962667 RepID=UPI0025D1452D|nr:M36 family metallopeptidase [Nannocystis sp.]MBK7830389.1 M36 family metallopeptidase [Nannocystis sp.]